MLRLVFSKLLLILTGGIFAVGIIEVVVRVFNPQYLAVSQVADPVLLWRRRPNLDMRVLNADGEWFSLQTNEDGFRTHEFKTLPKGRRILFFGDSFIEGNYVPDTCLFVNRVETLLRERTGENYICLNLGVAGYGLDQQVLLYNRVRSELHADFVAQAYFAGNDLEDVATRTLFSIDDRGNLISNVDERQNFTISKRLYYMTKNFFLHDLHLFSAILWPLSKNPDFIRLMTRLGLFHIDLAAIDEKGRPFSYRHEQYRKSPGQKIKSAREKFSKLLSMMNDRIRSDGASHLIFYIPAEEEVYADKWAKFKSDAAPGESPQDSGVVEDTVREIVESKRIPFVSLLPLFRAAAHRERLYYPKDGHWNCKTQDMAAHAFVEAIIPYVHKQSP